VTFRDLLGKFFGFSDGNELTWGKYRVPGWLTNYHFMAVGTTGSGKTTLLRILLRGNMARPGGLLGRLAKGDEDTRLVIYDPKVEWITDIADAGLADRRLIFHPFDARSVGWDLAADFTTYADAEVLANLLISRNDGPNAFFYNAANTLLKELIWAFIILKKTKGQWWEFRDVLNACRNVNDIEAILTAAGLKTGAVADFLTQDKEARSVRMTITVENGAYGSIAAAWHTAKRKVSLRDFVDSKDVLILGASKAYRDALATINRLVLRRLSSLVFEHPKAHRNRRCWFVIDEMPSLGFVPFLEELATEGRGKGAPLVVGFQHKDHVHDLYRGKASSLLDQFWTAAFFNVQSQEMARWVSERFPPCYDPDPQRPWDLRESPSVYPGQVMRLKPANEVRGFECIIKAPTDVIPGPKLIKVTPAEVLPEPARPAAGDLKRAAFIPRDPDQTTLTEWDKYERKKFGLPETPAPGAELRLGRLVTPADVWTDIEHLVRG
jgi:hypothetical protein